MPRNVKRIALLLPQDVGYSREVLRGIQKFALARPHWVFRDAPPARETIVPLREWKADGIIALLFDREVADLVRRLHKPLVNTTSTLDLPTVPLVENDHGAIGKMAAEYFLRRGFRNFGYFGSDWMGSSLAREAAFRARVEAAGFGVSTCHGEYLPRPSLSGSWVQVDQRIETWLRGLRKPVAVLAQNDVPARDIADRCRQLGLNVPHDVALLGVDNDDLECRLCHPPLSSIAIPGRKIGAEAAQTLDLLLRGRRPKPLQRFFPPIRVVERQSTDVLAIDDELVSVTLRLIKERAISGISIDAMLRDAPLSRRQVERRFREHTGGALLDEVHRVRVETAKQLLAETSFDMARIARESGFYDARRLSVVFKQVIGLTPSEFRQQLT